MDDINIKVYNDSDNNLLIYLKDVGIYIDNDGRIKALLEKPVIKLDNSNIDVYANTRGFELALIIRYIRKHEWITEDEELKELIEESMTHLRIILMNEMKHNINTNSNYKKFFHYFYSLI